MKMDPVALLKPTFLDFKPSEADAEASVEVERAVLVNGLTQVLQSFCWVE